MNSDQLGEGVVQRSGGRAVILGANGQLGRALTTALPGAAALGSADLDIGDDVAVERFDWSGVGLVYNAAAYTAVDRAESDRAAAWRVNAIGPANLARAAARHGFGVVHVSTEYVFDGTGFGPIPEDAPVAPISVYGASKAAGEIVVGHIPRHWLVRTSWVVGDGHNFVRTMLDLAGRGISPTVVSDQIGRPTFAHDLARALTEIVESEPGTYHLTNDGEPVSWAQLAREVFVHAGRDGADVRDVNTAEYFTDKPHAAARPANSVLDLSRATRAGLVMPAWRDSLTTYLRGAS